jgi:acyl-CoA hydrolase
MAPKDKPRRKNQLVGNMMFKAVFPDTNNHYNTLFGGTAIHQMNEVALLPLPVSAAR